MLHLSNGPKVMKFFVFLTSFFFGLFQDSVEHCIIGVTILSQLTNEINQVSIAALRVSWFA